MSTLLQDVRYGLRVLRKSPGVTLLAVAALAFAQDAQKPGRDPSRGRRAGFRHRRQRRHFQRCRAMRVDPIEALRYE